MAFCDVDGEATPHPLVLDCLHIPCPSHVNLEAVPGMIVCLKCNHQTKVPAGGIDALRRHWPALRQSSADTALVCMAGDGEAATHFCAKCDNELMCTTCAEKHRRHMKYRHHTPEAITPGGTVAVELPVPCETHPSEVVKLYCATCDVPICALCTATTTHRQHDVQDIPAAAGAMRDRLRDLLTRHSSHFSAVTAAADRAQQRLAEVDAVVEIVQAELAAALETDLAEVQRRAEDKRAAAHAAAAARRAELADRLAARQALTERMQRVEGLATTLLTQARDNEVVALGSVVARLGTAALATRVAEHDTAALTRDDVALQTVSLVAHAAQLEEKLAAVTKERDTAVLQLEQLRASVGRATASAVEAAVAGPDAPPARFRPGDKVKLSVRFAEFGDASQGPLAAGDIGEVVEDDGSSMPYNVMFHGQSWWYKAEALVPASSAEQAGNLNDLPGFAVTKDNAIPGLPVVRGRDWKWGDQDGGPGKHGHLAERQDEGWWGVRWDSGTSNVYRVGAERSYDLRYGNTTVEAHVHELIPQRCGGGWTCDMCGREEATALRWRCGSVCDWDACGECVARAIGSTSTGRLQQGGLVKLSPTYMEHSDASGGPLQPGDVGLLVVDDMSGKPYQVRAASGKMWWYDAAALVAASPEEAAAHVTSIPVTVASAARRLPVRRGKDWKWGDQDGHGVGSLVEDAGDAWWKVVWTNGTDNTYRVGKADSFDLEFAPGSHRMHPHTLVPWDASRSDWRCDVCRASGPSASRWRCDRDNFNVCGGCMSSRE